MHVLPFHLSSLKESKIRFKHASLDVRQYFVCVCVSECISLAMALRIEYSYGSHQPQTIPIPTLVDGIASHICPVCRVGILNWCSVPAYIHIVIRQRPGMILAYMKIIRQPTTTMMTTPRHTYPQ